MHGSSHAIKIKIVEKGKDRGKGFTILSAFSVKDVLAKRTSKTAHTSQSLWTFKSELFPVFIGYI